MIPKQRFYTVDEAAQILRVSIYTVRRKIHSGDIPALKYGRQYLIPVDYLTKVIDWGRDA